MSQVEGFQRRSTAFRKQFGGLPSNNTLALIDTAANEALKFQHNWIGTEHLLLATALDPQTAPILTNFHLEPDSVRDAIEFIIGKGKEPVDRKSIGLTSRSKTVLTLSVEEAKGLNDRLVEPIHVALGLVREGEGIATGIIESKGNRPENVRTILLQARLGREVATEPAPTFLLEDAQRDLADLNKLLTHPGLPISDRSNIAAIIRTVNRTFNPKYRF